MNQVIIVLITGAIGLALGLLIYWANAKLPHKVRNTDEIRAINKALPGTDCGACGYGECLAYAQALYKDPGLANQTLCPFVLQSSEAMGYLGEALGVSLDSPDKKAVIHCGGRSDVIFNYSGVRSCRAVAQLLSGYKRCPYACLGLGDCVAICPQAAISIDKEDDIAIVDREKCNGCGLCVAECPQELIELVPAATEVSFRCNYRQPEDIPGRERCDYARQAAACR